MVEEEYAALSPASSAPDLGAAVSPHGPLDDMLDGVAEGLQVLDFDYRYLYVNAAAAAHGRTSRAGLIGRTLLEAYPGVEHTEMFRNLQRCMCERVSHRMDNEFTFPDGQKRWFELRIEPVPEGVLIFSLDIEQRRRLEAQLAQAQKMEAVGLLAGAVAHDFNNLLTVILSYGQFVLAGLPNDSVARADIEEIIAAATRGAGLTRQLLTLSRRQVLEPTVLSVNDAVRELEPMLRRLCGETVEVRTQLAASGDRIRVDAGQLDQVLMNLVANARDAMPDGGRLSVRTENVELDASNAQLNEDVTAGPYVMIEIADTGCGMDAETLRHMFEPFFTTKAPGRGTGLGLATSHGIVRQSGGYIGVFSEPGRGSVFKLYFPRVFEAAKAPSRASASLATEQRGREVVLLVEDEAPLRTLCARALKARGYTVLEAQSPHDAVRFSEGYSGCIDALVTDIAMPGLDGPTLATKLLKSRPELRVLYMSGYADHALLAGVDTLHYLEKPFSPEALASKLRLLLDPAAA